MILSPRTHRRAAFTLIELLAVIAVIAVLSAILIPVIGSARERAQQSGSVANLRSLGQAFSLYTNEHGGRIFPFRGSEAGAKAWHLYLLPYVGDDESVFRSPGDPSDPERIERTYRMNISGGTGGYGEPSEGNSTSLFGKYVSQITYPASTFLLLDISYTGTTEIPFEAQHTEIWWDDLDRQIDSLSSYQRTFGPDNQLALFVDGHVESVPVPFNPRLFYYELK